MTKKRDVFISKGKGTPITIGKKERRTDLLPEQIDENINNLESIVKKTENKKIKDKAA